VHGALLGVEVDAGGAVVYRLLQGQELTLSHRGRALTLDARQPEIRMEDKA
jgi:hypothetical protein